MKVHVVKKSSNYQSNHDVMNNLRTEEEVPSVEFPEEMMDLIRQVGAQNDACFRQCRTLLAGFKATNETDIRYMDGYMDRLFDFMDQGDDVEVLYREYIGHISSFNKEEGTWRAEDLNEHLGYWAPAVYAAAQVAKELHKGQKDKGGNDYFKSHLMKVGCAGTTWKRQMVGFLHDAAEDTGRDVETVIHLVKEKLESWSAHPEDDAWKDAFEEDIFPMPGKVILIPSEKDWNEIVEALHVLNHHTAPTRAEYIERFRGKLLALHVKLADMQNNMDISRIAIPTEKDFARLERYKTEYDTLMQMLCEYYEQHEN